MKTYSFNDLEDEYFGKPGTPEREKYEEGYKKHVDRPPSSKVKFQKRTPKEAWDAYKTQAQIDRVKSDMSKLSKFINKYDNQLIAVKREHEKAKEQMRNKSKYLTQLMNQLIEINHPLLKP